MAIISSAFSVLHMSDLLFVPIFTGNRKIDTFVEETVLNHVLLRSSFKRL